jgi:serine/threonine protein kinase/TolB-like protein/Tfp pilus assembly protein PilF
MSDSHERQAAIFEEAMSVPEAARAAFLDQACADDAALRERVVSLLRAHLAAGDFLAASPLGDSPELKPGARVGRYKLREKLGEGGVGIVFLAEQDEPFRRQVALKVIKPGMDTREIIARFESERQALALMDHPNIARVFDAGAIASGRPFFVMELVSGPPLTTYCDREALTIEARVELFAKICAAIQHAHAKGVIHRDIKPSNILVTTQDGVAVPKVIDFGIAKATEFKLTEKTIHTGFTHFMGTPPYLSPEQAELGGREVDARTDIYSLGVVLYELLTGRTPFDGRALAEAGLDELRRRIREDEPTRPSVGLTRLDAATLAALAQQRRIEADRLPRLLRRELDWIILRCLEKDRARRYPTASALGEDLQHHLRHEPVSAVAPSLIYVWRKRLRRRRTAIAFAAAAAVTLGAIGFAWSGAQRPGPSPTAPERPPAAKTIAVLAFEDRSAESGDLRFADRVSEELINVLERVPGLRLQARTSAFQLKGQKLSIPEIARRLGVAYVVDGNVTVDHGTVTIAARLADAAGFNAGWSNRFTCPIDEVYAQQDKMAGEIARALHVNPGSSVASRRSTDPEVRRLVLEGRYFWNQRDAQGFRRAEESFRKAIERDPRNAEAHAGLASTCVIREQYRVFDTGPATDDPARVRSEARLAIQYDPTLAEPWLALAYEFFIEGKLAEAQRHFEHAASLSPNSAHLHMWYALLQSTQGKLDEALARLGEVSQSEPLWFINLQIHTWELGLARRFDRALEINDRAGALRSDFIPQRGERARILLALGRTPEAVVAARTVLANPEAWPRWHADGVAIWVLRMAGQATEATMRGEELMARLPADSYKRGLVLSALGRFGEAVPFLEHSPVILFRSLYWEEIWDPWREDPRFQALLVKLGCAEEYKVARASLARLAPAQAAAPLARVSNPTVQRLILEGRHYWFLRTHEGFEHAEAAFRAAADLEPDLAEAHAGLAGVYVMREQYRQFDGRNPSPEDPALARATAERAIRLDPGPAAPYAALAYAHYLEGNLTAADQLYEKAIARDPNYPIAYGWHGMSLAAQGRLGDSIARLQKASELDSLWFIDLQFLSWDLALARRYEEALRVNERAATLRPDDYIPNVALRGRIQLALGRRAAAIELARLVRRKADFGPRWNADVDALWILRQTGQNEEAADYAAELLQQLPPASFLRGFVLTALGRFEEGAPYLEHLPVAMRRPLFWDEMFDPVRDERRFRELLAKLGCEAEYAVGRKTLARFTDH